MISYEPLWKTMKKKRISTYALIERYGIYKATIQRLRRGQNVTTRTLEDLCRALDCPVNEVLEIRFDSEPPEAGNVPAEADKKDTTGNISAKENAPDSRSDEKTGDDRRLDKEIQTGSGFP